MRSLIRPTLFWVARMGLFLSLATWCIGQSWQGTGHLYGFVGAIDQFGLGASMGPNRGAGVNRNSDYEIVKEFLDGTHVPSKGHFIGMAAIALYIGTEWAMAIRHYLVVAIFALFYGMLKWVYRKRAVAGE